MPNNNDADGHKGKEESGYAAASKGASAASVAEITKRYRFSCKQG